MRPCALCWRSAVTAAPERAVLESRGGAPDIPRRLHSFTQTRSLSPQAHAGPHTRLHPRQGHAHMRGGGRVTDTRRHIPIADVPRYKLTCTGDLTLVAEDTRTCRQKRIQRHTQDTDTRSAGNHNLTIVAAQETDTHRCIENMRTLRDTRTGMDPSDADARPSERNRPTDTPFICSISICGAPTTGQGSSAARAPAVQTEPTWGKEAKGSSWRVLEGALLRRRKTGREGGLGDVRRWRL